MEYKEKNFFRHAEAPILGLLILDSAYIALKHTHSTSFSLTTIFGLCCLTTCLLASISMPSVTWRSAVITYSVAIPLMLYLFGLTQDKLIILPMSLYLIHFVFYGRFRNILKMTLFSEPMDALVPYLYQRDFLVLNRDPAKLAQIEYFLLSNGCRYRVNGNPSHTSQIEQNSSAIKVSKRGRLTLL